MAYGIMAYGIGFLFIRTPHVQTLPRLETCQLPNNLSALVTIFSCFLISRAVADLGEGPGGPGPPYFG